MRSPKHKPKLDLPVFRERNLTLGHIRKLAPPLPRQPGVVCLKQKPGNAAPSVSDVETLRIWRAGVWRVVRSKAEHQFHRLGALAEEQKQEGFNAAAERYVHVMWQWMMNHTPEDLRATINNLKWRVPADPNEADKLQRAKTQQALYYFLRRAWFLEGLKHGEAHNPEWYRSFAPWFDMADRLNDMDVFRALAAAKQKRESKKPRPGWGLLRFRILTTWLAGGLWCLPSDGERCKALNEFWKDSGQETATEEGFKTARQALKL